MKVVRYDFGEFLIYENYVMSIINNGAVFGKEQYEILLAVFKKYFKDRPFRYISNRIYPYAIDPIIYLDNSGLDDLFAIAIVSDNCATVERSYKLESFFYKGHFKHYDNLNEAQSWISTLLVDCNTRT